MGLAVVDDAPHVAQNHFVVGRDLAQTADDARGRRQVLLHCGALRGAGGPVKARGDALGWRSVGERMGTDGENASGLNRATIEAAFDLVGRKGLHAGLQMDIAVYGGSRLILASDIRDASGDVDAVFGGAYRTQIYAIVEEVAMEMRLAPNWMNEAVKRVAPPIGEPAPPLRLFGDYPRDTTIGSGLRVYLPTPEYMLAMKLLADRGGDFGDAEKAQTDTQDSLALMRLTQIDTRDKLFALLRTHYPIIMSMDAPHLQARLDFKIRDLLDAYAAEPARVATWDARRDDRAR